MGARHVTELAEADENVRVMTSAVMRVLEPNMGRAISAEDAGRIAQAYAREARAWGRLHRAMATAEVPYSTRIAVSTMRLAAGKKAWQWRTTANRLAEL
jgi:hypothetical protein